jgi:hypothetical protein
MPVGSAIAGRVRNEVSTAIASASLSPCKGQMLFGVEALQVFQPVVFRLSVAVMDVAAGRYWAKSAHPNVPMKFLAAAREVPIAWPFAIKAAAEILRDCIKHDRTNERRVRSFANLHPFAVMNI